MTEPFNADLNVYRIAKAALDADRARYDAQCSIGEANGMRPCGYDEARAILLAGRERARTHAMTQRG